MPQLDIYRPSACALAVFIALNLAACGGGGSSSSNDNTSSSTSDTPAAPAGLGYAETADAPSGVLAYIDTGATNQRGLACMATLESNAGVRVLKGFLDMWAPLAAADGKVYVDADVAAAADGSCPAVAKSSWAGIPGDATDGKVLNAAVHAANIDYVKTATKNRSTEQALAAYMDDRRKKGYSIADGMGPLTSIWRTGTGQTTTIVAPVDANAAVTKVDDSGNNLGLTTSALGTAVTFIDSGNIVDGSTEPAKRFFKYARPYRWSTDVIVVPSLESAKSSNAATDGGFPSGHTAEAWRDALPMAYLFPQRYQELITRAMEMGESRILAGMHSPLDVMGGRVQAIAVVAYSLNKTDQLKATAARKQVQDYLMAQTGTSDFNALLEKARTPVTSDKANANYDRFSNYAANKTFFSEKLSYGLPKIAANDGKAPTVPKGAEVLLETRQPYLTAAQRRVVLKTTQIDSGYPLANDEEGWGRLNLFAAADGYGAFNGDVSVTMDASLGGFNVTDSWRNNIAGSGKLSKLGTGTLRLAGDNSFSGGTQLNAGTLAADSVSALGKGDVYVSAGTLLCNAPGKLAIGGAYTQLAGTLQLALSSSTQGTLSITGTATLAGGALRVSFPGSYKPAVGDTLTVLTAAKRNGSFSSITVDGFKVTPTYTATGVLLHIDS
ncbi:phosphatase PAP2 family protein [Uliginosibacterium flavum]|uniref:Phosphatase PAP2 family protein n=1 Tax=Uliginosibacterium flavum TaxID=1396831 RepID=A0ABV2TIU0_9RHOO